MTDYLRDVSASKAPASAGASHLVFEVRGRIFTLPVHMVQALENFVRGDNHAPGHFLRCVLENDLRTAVFQADSDNICNLPAYVAWLMDNAPACSWGSPERVARWLNKSSEAHQAGVRG